MGKIPGLEYKSPNSAVLVDRAHMAPAAAKATISAPAPTAASSTKTVGNGVGNAGQKDTTAAARQAKWRAQHPEQHRDQMRALRAKRKAGKVGR
jgi:hypothetical protein